MPVLYKLRGDYNLKVKYEEANFLWGTAIVKNKVFCVICDQDFKGSERDEHLKRHIRKAASSPALKMWSYVT